MSSQAPSQVSHRQSMVSLANVREGLSGYVDGREGREPRSPKHEQYMVGYAKGREIRRESERLAVRKNRWT